jgi:vitamin K-dependent gamma-carboxylase-like protein
MRAAGRLVEPVDGASIACFRIAFGAIMLWEVIRYFSHGWIQRYYIQPAFHFTYYGFERVHPWPGPWMHLHFFVLGVLALAVALGVWYRAAVVAFFVGFSYVFLLDQARYLNHFYLITLLSFLLIFVPANRVWSIDARRNDRRTTTVRTWSLWLLRLQVGIPYFYAGVAKINADWLRGEPLGAWMAARADLPFVGSWLTHAGVVLLFAYGALLLDLLMVPGLLWKRSRPYAFAVACLFHLLNSQLFTIGIFPFLMITATTIFFPPDWPRKVIARIRAVQRERGESKEPALSESNGRFIEPSAASSMHARMATVLVAAYAAVQILVPLRHHLYPGDVNWTDEGHRFSWRMKLRDKNSTARFEAVDRVTGERIDVDWRTVLASWQFEEMSTRPDMILQFSHYLADDVRRRTGRSVGIHATVCTSLNSSMPQLLIDPAVDLSTRPRSLLPAEWTARAPIICDAAILSGLL